MKISKKNINIILRTLIIAFALVGMFFLVKELVPKQEQEMTGAPVKEISVDTSKLEGILGEKLQSNSLWVVLFLNTKCKYCHLSMPFYKEVSYISRKSNNIKLVGLFNQDVAETQQYLKENGVEVEILRRVRFKDISNVTGTPTMVFIDSNGKLVNKNIGILNPLSEVSIINLLKEHSTDLTEPIDSLALKENNKDWFNIISADKNLEEQINSGNYTLVDLNERQEYKKEHIIKAVNIPFDELEVRALNEVDTSKPVVIYDSSGDEAILRVRYKILIEQGFQNVYGLKGGLPAWKNLGFPTELLMQ